MNKARTFKPLHPWKVDLKQAKAIQLELSKKLIIQGEVNPRLIAGADCAFSKKEEIIYALVVVYDLQKDQVVEIARSKARLEFPYVPGYLTFREGPALLKAFARLKTKPEAVIFDGQGIAHPRRMGIASHLGLWLELPSLGCAKSLLVGKAREPENQPGAFQYLKQNEEIIGAVLRTKKGVKPVIISPGHLLSLKSAIQIALKSCRGYRLPEPARLAHLLVNRFKKEEEQ